MIWLWDTLRAFDLFLYCASVGVVADVIRLYYKASHHPEEEASERRKNTGLLPTHVWQIGSAYLGAITIISTTNITRLGEGFTLYIPANGAVLVLGLVALLKIRTYEQRRCRTLTGEEPPPPPYL